MNYAEMTLKELKNLQQFCQHDTRRMTDKTFEQDYQNIRAEIKDRKFGGYL